MHPIRRTDSSTREVKSVGYSSSVPASQPVRQPPRHTDSSARETESISEDRLVLFVSLIGREIRTKCHRNERLR